MKRGFVLLYNQCLLLSMRTLVMMMMMMKKKKTDVVLQYEHVLVRKLQYAL